MLTARPQGRTENDLWGLNAWEGKPFMDAAISETINITQSDEVMDGET
jgi:hypothetical protein